MFELIEGDRLPVQPNVEQARVFEETMYAGEEALGGGGNYISIQGKTFHLKSGQQDIPLLTKGFTPDGKPFEFPTPYIDVAIINYAKQTHLVYYENGYQPGSKDRPTAVWFAGDPLPDNVPPDIMTQKVSVNGRLTWRYQRKQRIALVFYESEKGCLSQELDQVYIMDINSLSIFAGDEYGFKNLVQNCARYKIHVNQFPIRIQIDNKADVPVVKFVPYTYKSKDERTVPWFFDPATAQKVYALGTDPNTISLLDPRGAIGIEEAVPETPAATGNTGFVIIPDDEGRVTPSAKPQAPGATDFPPPDPAEVPPKTASQAPAQAPAATPAPAKTKAPASARTSAKAPAPVQVDPDHIVKVDVKIAESLPTDKDLPGVDDSLMEAAKKVTTQAKAQLQGGQINDALNQMIDGGV
jgi:hypothetical protein